MRTVTPYVAFARLPSQTRRTTVLVVARPSADLVRVYGPDGRLHDLPRSAVGRPRRSPQARVQAVRLQAEYGRLRALLRGLAPHSHGRRGTPTPP